MSVNSAAEAVIPSRPEGIHVPDIGSVMHAPVVTVDEHDNLWTAMDVMLTRGLRHLVVTCGSVADGVLSDRDLANVWALDPLGLKHRHAREALGPRRTFVSPEATVVEAATTMRELGTDALVVVDADLHPVGVVTDHDLLGHLAALLKGHV